jgi:RNA polymerase sigma-B factor
LALDPRALTRDELAELFRRWQDERATDARDLLIARFAPLARKLARRYAGVSEPFDDLLQVANVGLLLAINRFDHRRGIAFTSFAVPTILGELRRYFRDAGWAVHVPRSAQEHALEVERAVVRYTQGQGRAPTVSQLAQMLEWSIDRVVDALEAASAHHSVSLDSPGESSDGETQTLLDAFGADDPGFELAVDRLSVAAATRRLEPHHKRLLYERFVSEKTQSEIGAELGVSQMQVSRILRQLLDSLRSMADAAPTTAEAAAGSARCVIAHPAGRRSPARQKET